MDYLMLLTFMCSYSVAASTYLIYARMKSARQFKKHRAEMSSRIKRIK